MVTAIPLGRRPVEAIPPGEVTGHLAGPQRGARIAKIISAGESRKGTPAGHTQLFVTPDFLFAITTYNLPAEPSHLPDPKCIMIVLTDAGQAAFVVTGGAKGGSNMNLKAKLLAVAGGLVLAGGASAATAAVISLSPVDSSGAIHGCYARTATNGSHVFEMQNAGTHCPSGYIAITWNQHGGDQAIVVPASIFVSDSDTNTQEIAEATCPAGYIGTGGGFAALWDATAEQWRLDVSAPGEVNPPPGWNESDGDNSWEVLFDRTGPVGSGTGSTQVAAYVNCSPSHDVGATGPG